MAVFSLGFGVLLVWAPGAQPVAEPPQGHGESRLQRAGRRASQSGDLLEVHPFVVVQYQGEAQRLRQLREGLGDELSRRLWRFAERNAGRLEARARDRSLIHADYKPWNLLVRPGGSSWSLSTTTGPASPG